MTQTCSTSASVNCCGKKVVIVYFDEFICCAAVLPRRLTLASVSLTTVKRTLYLFWVIGLVSWIYKASDWLIFGQGPIRGFVCEFQYELLNFTTKFRTKFATFGEKLYEINCNCHIRIDLC